MLYGYYDTKHPRYLRDEYISLFIGIACFMFIIFCIVTLILSALPKQIISPLQEAGQSAQLQIPVITSIPTVIPMPTVIQRPTKGKASYYSINGCIGCNPGRIMANGQKLDDAKLTIAYNHAPLGTKITIRNTKTGASVTAIVTDRGGFERHGKIADLSVATRDALGCGDTCPIELIW